MSAPVGTAGLRGFRVDGQVALITGGAKGIGLACATLMAEAGARVVLLDRDERALKEARAQLPNTDTKVLDVTDEAAVESAFAAIAAEHGGLHILVNNAGLAIRKPSLELPLADWNAVVAVNLTAVFVCARAAARHMKAGGSIVNTASMMGLSGRGLYPNISYQTTKGGVINMTRSLAIEWAPLNIRVNAVAPTWTKTGFIGQLEQSPELMARIREVTPLKRLAEPHEVASAVLYLASPAAAMVTGHILAVDGGFLAQ